LKYLFSGLLCCAHKDEVHFKRGIVWCSNSIFNYNVAYLRQAGKVVGSIVFSIEIALFRMNMDYSDHIKD